MSSSTHVVIVGNGVAGVTAAKTIKDEKPETQVSIFTDENSHYYPRPTLYQVLSGEKKPQDAMIFSEEWYNKKGLDVHLGKKAIQLNTEHKELQLEDHSKVTYDKLLLANGAHSFVPPIKGAEKKGTFTLRTIQDALTIKEYSADTNKAIVIGGGLLGLEFASALTKCGQQVTIVERSPRLLSRQLDSDGASILQKHIESLGINTILNATTTKIVGKNTVSGITLTNGKTLHGDLILISAGIRSNIELAQKAGINVNRGIIVDNHLQTSANNVYAAGDSAEFNGNVYGIIPAAMEQAKIAAQNITGNKNSIYAGTVPSNTLKIVNIDLTSIGLVNPEDPKYEEIKETDPKKGIYKKIVLDKNKIVGAIILGDTKGVFTLKNLLDQKTDISKYKKSILKDDFDFKEVAA